MTKYDDLFRNYLDDLDKEEERIAEQHKIDREVKVLNSVDLIKGIYENLVTDNRSIGIVRLSVSDTKEIWNDTASCTRDSLELIPLFHILRNKHRIIPHTVFFSAKLIKHLEENPPYYQELSKLVSLTTLDLGEDNSFMRSYTPDNTEVMVLYFKFHNEAFSIKDHNEGFSPNSKLLHANVKI